MPKATAGSPAEGSLRAGSHRAALRSQAVAFGIVKGLSYLTIAVLAIILGFIVYRGLRYSNITRSTVLPYEETVPDGLVIAVNAERRLSALDWERLYGMFTDEYINWAKLDGTDEELAPIAVEPSAPEGARAEDFLFGSREEGGYPLWGGLVEFQTSAAQALKAVAERPGAVALVPESAMAGAPKGVKAVALRRMAVVLNPDVMEFEDESYLEDLSVKDVAALFAGEIPDWKELGGPSLAAAPLLPPSGMPEAMSAARAAGVIQDASGGATGAGAEGPEGRTPAGYLALLSETSGAAGIAPAGDATRAGLPLAWITGVKRGWNLTPRFLLEEPGLAGKTGGISTIILNTFMMLALTVAFAAPLGVMAAVYLVEYARQGPLLRLLRLGTETLAGIPSIIFGLFGFLFFVTILGFGFGLLSGSLTLTLMILPTIVRTSEEALKAVPRSLREGSLALGATKLQTIFKVVVPTAAPGILTGLLLAVGRAVGETAALLFTMGADYKLARGLFSSARSLSSHVYLLFAEGVSFDMAFSTATVLVAVVLIFNLSAKRLVARMRRGAAA